ncbi:MAG: exopolysaccharide biosynthesis protein [Acidobacteria bacterium]|nr:exopolysaccharide biosynthesis protein [Acidobacteriota bacterium]
MIDIHSHILPGLDDGAKTLEEAVAMVRMAAAAGTTDIVATPHANQEYVFDPHAVERKISELQAAAGESPRIYFGCDLHLMPESIDDALHAREKYSINHKCYQLVEFSDFFIPKNADEILAGLRHAHLRPIVTHPERNQLLQNRLDDLEAWVAEGALLQVTAASFLGRFGRTAKRVSDELMGRGLVHFVASDAHDLKWRTTALDESYRYVARTFGEEAAARVFEENPQAAISGVPLSATPIAIKRRRWYSLR